MAAGGKAGGSRFEVDALDQGMDSIRRASIRLRPRRLPVRFVRGDVYRLPFRDGVFDAVAASEIIEHLDRPAEAWPSFPGLSVPAGSLSFPFPGVSASNTPSASTATKKPP